MTQLIGAVMLAGLAVWCIADPTVMVETWRAIWDRPDPDTRDTHRERMDALDRARTGR